MPQVPSSSGLGSDVPASERDQIVDALYRFGAAQDLDDEGLLEATFTADATLDFVQPAKRFGATLDVFRGRKQIVEIVMTSTAEIDTTHTMTNPRITAYDGERATVWALVEAQHLPHGDHSRHLLLKNFYDLAMQKVEGRWLIKDMVITNVWFAGAPEVLFKP
ncbi:nuclear transport factor 2 family protein [Mesorhizobium sp. B2-4-9]|uniref:nuclear transport factor 2 family protein n=1 Tax=Mesorhizobium sp. B2-4-9 TaxID=2589940 RepID=UPI0015E330DB|nr:nuclear transport factor 2 family protein [Mesorhizobium sp. B2-4-9]